MKNYLNGYSPYIYSLMRFVIGFFFVLHGAQKLFNLPPSAKPTELNALVGAAGVIELICGLLIAVGLFAGIAAFIASGQMAVAYFMAHQPAGALPIQNGGELAAVYSFIFLYIAARGSGLISLDSLLFKRRDNLD